MGARATATAERTRLPAPAAIKAACAAARSLKLMCGRDRSMRPHGAMTAGSVAALTVGGLAFNILLKARGLIVVPLYAWLLSPYDLGVISLAAALATLVAPAVHLGLPLGMLVELPHARPPEAVGRAFRSSLAVIGTASAAACLLLMWAISAVHSLQPLAPHALVIGALAAGMALREVGQVVPQLHRQVR